MPLLIRVDSGQALSTAIHVEDPARANPPGESQSQVLVEFVRRRDPKLGRPEIVQDEKRQRGNLPNASRNRFSRLH